MRVVKTEFEGLLLIEPVVKTDRRGYFYEAFNKQTFYQHGIDFEFAQENQSRSMQGVLRGMHFQRRPFEQRKLVRVISGEIQDVVVDLRKSQSTFGRYYSIVLSAEKKQQLLIPGGFAHGFLVLSEWAEVLYKCDKLYNPDAEGGIVYHDPVINIKWDFSFGGVVMSEKDKLLPTLEAANYNF
ncbi:MAG: dTDP-4-dehydrorhamnose 3,5-epimerase [Bacteroidetes bacterium]|nr:dTDP-4-dehydrorhamnose 3,5-epimerase [Bacteroidota bacterium]